MKNLIIKSSIVFLLFAVTKINLFGQASTGPTPTYWFLHYKEPIIEGTHIGTILFRGINELKEGYLDVAKIQVTATAQGSNGQIPGKMNFFTGTTIPNPRMTISEEGLIGIDNEYPNAKFAINHFLSKTPVTNSILSIKGGQFNTPKIFEISYNPTANFLSTRLTGEMSIYEGNFTTIDGHITATNGNITTNSGKIIAKNDNIIAEQGGLIAKEGKITAENNDIVALNGNLMAQNGKLFIGTGNINNDPARFGGNHVGYFNGSILCTTVKIDFFNNWPDYVFEENYKLKSLKTIEKYILEKKHLPGIPSAKKVEKEGFDAAEMISKLLEKIEELRAFL